jgi:hypothetical protein
VYIDTRCKPALIRFHRAPVITFSLFDRNLLLHRRKNQSGRRSKWDICHSGRNGKRRLLLLQPRRYILGGEIDPRCALRIFEMTLWFIVRILLQNILQFSGFHGSLLSTQQGILQFVRFNYIFFILHKELGGLQRWFVNSIRINLGSVMFYSNLEFLVFFGETQQWLVYSLSDKKIKMILMFALFKWDRKS